MVNFLIFFFFFGKKILIIYLFLKIRFGQYIVSTLPLISEKHLVPREGEGTKEGEGENILLRNRCLQLLHSLLYNGSKLNAK